MGRVSQGISVDSSRKSSHLYCMLWTTGQLRSKRGGNAIHLVLISATPSYFAFLSWHQSSSRLVTVFWGLFGVLSRKLRLLTCLIGNTILLCTKCREIKPHLPVRGKCHGNSRVAAGTWGIFSSYSGNGHSKLHFVQRSQDSCLVTTDTSRIKTSLERIIQMLFEVRWETTRPFLVLRKILGFLSIFKKSQASSPLKHWTPCASRVVKRCEAPCPDESGN